MLRGYLTAGCDLQTIGTLLRNCILGGPDLYEERRKRRDRTNAKLKSAIKGLAAAAEFYRDWGQLADAARMETEKARFDEFLVRAKKAFETKRLGALNAKELPVALIFLAVLDDYIMAKTTRHPAARELSWLMEAIFVALGHPKEDVDPNLLAIKLKQFRERNPHIAREIAAYATQI